VVVRIGATSIDQDTGGPTSSPAPGRTPDQAGGDRTTVLLRDCWQQDQGNHERGQGEPGACREAVVEDRGPGGVDQQRVAGCGGRELVDAAEGVGGRHRDPEGAADATPPTVRCPDRHRSVIADQAWPRP
jgi:hypothetical protein